jgi:hypothetical protein
MYKYLHVCVCNVIMICSTHIRIYGRRNGRDCNFNVIVNVAEARGLAGKGGTGLNDCRAKVLLFVFKVSP